MATTLADRSPLSRRLSTQRKKRRGIVLLMVVSLLALFLLMGVTFAILAIQYKDAANVQAATHRYGDPPMQEMEMAVGAVLYDSQGRGAVRGHSLLRDYYGADYVHTTVSGAPLSDNRKTVTNQFLVFQMSTSSISGSVANIPGYYNGRVLTFITGAAAGISTRVAGYEPTDPGTNQTEIYVEALVGSSGNLIRPASGDQFVINGQPFNGMGFGYDPATYRLDAVDGNNRPVVLLPHYAGYQNQQVQSSMGGLTMSPDVGGADEPYDSAGPQDPHLAVYPPGLIASLVSGSSNRFSVPLIPSFNPAPTINYWLDRSRWPSTSMSPPYTQLTQPAQKNLARQMIFRPMPWDHTNFTGSNPDLTANAQTDDEYDRLIRLMAQSTAAGSNGYWEAIWDVDNDGDGVRDSVWVDIGLPVMTSPSGRRYKRLYAFLIKDLDGRINLNVHGNRAQSQSGVVSTNAISYPFQVFGTGVQPNAVPPLPLQPFPNGRGVTVPPVGTVQLPRGMGFGPAEVDFRYVLQIPAPPALPTPPLTNYYDAMLLGRYGGDGVPGINGDDALSAVKMSGVPADFTQDSWYGSPPDVWGRNAVAVDFGGKPMFYRESIAVALAQGETIDDPYEMEWDPRTARNDSPYTPGDMEVLLRMHDDDVRNGQFQTQLPYIAPNLFYSPGDPSVHNGDYQRVRESITTMSSSTPVVPGIFRYEDRQFHGSGSTIAASDAPGAINMYRRKILQGNPSASPAQISTILGQIMPWEYWQGKPLDLNRFLNNGVDDNSNGANGEPAEAGANETAFGTNSTTPSTVPSNGSAGGTLPTAFSGLPAYHANSVDVDGDGAQDGVAGRTNDRTGARQLMARHLYCLMLALNGTGYMPPNVSGAAPTQQATIKMFAQWAVNIVDFRDTDGIMTCFEYDTNPWDGWHVDGNPSTTNEPNRGVVWGCEAPELVMTEGFAMHDRGTKDTKFDITGKERSEVQMPDDDVDQFRVPKGSIFFELFCPRTHPHYNTNSGDSIFNPQLPYELYDSGTKKLDLARMAPGGNPVWQVAIAKLSRNPQAGLPTSGHLQTPNTWETAGYSDPLDPNLTNQASYNLQYNMQTQNPPTIDIERYVWFTNNNPTTPKRNNVFYNRLSFPAQLSPGQYMVVGPREQTHFGSKKSADPGNPGASNGFWHGHSPQHIFLTTAGGVEVTDNSTGIRTSKLSTPATTAAVQPVLPMVAMMRPPDPATNPPGWPQKVGDTNWWVGMNITEPLPQTSYYAEYNQAEDINARPNDAYDDPGTPMNLLPDLPEDNRPGRPLSRENMLESNIYQNASALFLQRLADPTRAWDPLNNPYITVDFMPLDVTVFSGDEDTSRTVKTNPNDNNSRDIPVDPSDLPPGGNRITRLETTQRAAAAGNIWFPRFTDTQLNPAPARSDDRYMRWTLHHTLGYINEDVAATPRSAATYGQAVAGDPDSADSKPFPWITWNNRPFMNAAELLLVPTSAPNRLVLEISPDNPVIPAAASNPYQPQPTIGGDGRAMRRPFTHLMNMFQSSTTDASSMNLVRMLDYVEVPSNFMGAERWYYPGDAGNPTAAPNPSTPGGLISTETATLRPEYTPPYLYRPPFNKLSRFRDPGKVNINTIYDSAIWSAIVGYDANNVNAVSGVNVTTAGEIFLSRQGYPGNVGQMSNDYPTLFANPFRPADTADLMPNAGTVNMRNTPPTDATLFRRSTTRNGEPLFAYQPTTSPQITLDDIRFARDPDRNAYFRYQGLQKLPNIVGTQSNCYAVWATVGYFEVEDVGSNTTYPDGFMLGQELDIDQGKAQRHRGFFLIDRSIPAGFIPGVKLNTDNCILLRRQID